MFEVSTLGAEARVLGSRKETAAGVSCEYTRFVDRQTRDVRADEKKCRYLEKVTHVETLPTEPGQRHWAG